MTLHLLLTLPAVFGMTRDPFTVFSSNLFAILDKVYDLYIH
ncbi:hypothetical protein Lser_V15G04859 [Lactuca serriola]